MRPSEKCRTLKYNTEMDFQEFCSWSAGHVLFGIAEGKKLRDLMVDVILAVTMNEVFGGKKPA